MAEAKENDTHTQAHTHRHIQAHTGTHTSTHTGTHETKPQQQQEAKEERVAGSPNWSAHQDLTSGFIKSSQEDEPGQHHPS